MSKASDVADLNVTVAEKPEKTLNVDKLNVGGAGWRESSSTA